jgi:hypothetical protein
VSTTPRYSRVRISEQRAREAAAAAEAARRLLAEASKRKRDAELAEYKRKHEQRRREMLEAHARQQASRAESVRGTEPASRRGAPGHRRRRDLASSPFGTRESRPTREQPPEQQLPYEDASNEHAPTPQAQPQSMLAAGEGVAVAGFDVTESNQPELDYATVEAAVTARAAAKALIDALRPWPALQQSAEDLDDAAAELGVALDADDERATIAATSRLDELVTKAHAEHDVLQAARARRRVIATAVADALPERYGIGDATERPDGSIRFLASGPEDELLVAVLDDGAGAEAVAYKIDGGSFHGQLDVPPGVDDCPGLTRELARVHERAAANGFDFGPLRWQDAEEEAPSKKGRGRGSGAAKRSRGKS